MIAVIDEVDDPAPAPFSALTEAELRTLQGIIDKLAGS